MRIFALALAGLACVLLLHADVPASSCAAGVLVADLSMSVVPPAGGTPKSLRSVNVLQPGDRLQYTPNKLAPENPKKAEIAVVLVPAEAGRLVTLDPKPAAKPAEWIVPVRTAVVALVYGLQGLNEKKIDRERFNRMVPKNETA